MKGSAHPPRPTRRTSCRCSGTGRRGSHCSCRGASARAILLPGHDLPSLLLGKLLRTLPSHLPGPRRPQHKPDTAQTIFSISSWAQGPAHARRQMQQGLEVSRQEASGSRLAERGWVTETSLRTSEMQLESRCPRRGDTHKSPHHGLSLGNKRTPETSDSTKDYGRAE